jgi:hypothetical protein
MSEEKPKKINTNAKGYRNEQKTARYLEKLGYVVCTTQRSSHRGNNDFFNAFDHIAVLGAETFYYKRVFKVKTQKMTYALNQVVFVQTRSNRKGSTDKIRQFAESTNSGMNSILIFVWKDREARPCIYTWDQYNKIFVEIIMEDDMKTI